jgi:hypothetical protein
MSVSATYLDSAVKRFLSYKELGEGTFSQLEEKDFHMQPDEDSNSIAQIIRHMGGNMLSRWTNFLTEDGEKPWRQRDQEFEVSTASRQELLKYWEDCWQCLLGTLKSLREEDLEKTIYIRSEPHIVLDAINRQLSHYPYHVGQIVYIGKMIRKGKWKSLSIPKGQSESFNQQMQRKAPK